MNIFEESGPAPGLFMCPVASVIGVGLLPEMEISEIAARLIYFRFLCPYDETNPKAKSERHFPAAFASA
jgi:hypothetical protein